MSEVDITGKKFNMLVAMNRVRDYANSKDNYWRFKCDCGNIVIHKKYDVVHGLCVSCGCYGRELRRKLAITHGLRKHPLYPIWTSMKQRCFNQNHDAYYNYGARGITVCDEWKNNFVAFYTWSLNNGYAKGLSIDRIDNNGDYTPANCRWISMDEQRNNTRRSVIITAFSESHCAAEWARITGISETAIKDRIRRQNLSPEEALCNIDRRRKRVANT